MRGLLRVIGTAALSLASTIFLVAQPANAAPFDADTAIFTKANQAILCLDGKVERDALAEQIVNALQIPLSMRRSTNYRDLLTSNQWSGRNPQETAAYERIAQAMGSLDTWLYSGSKTNEYYDVVVRGGGEAEAYEIFEDNSPVTIVCVDKAAAPASSPPQPRSKAEASETRVLPKTWKAQVIVRKSVDDIPIESSKITKANAALLSYSEDREENSQSATIDGLIGVTIAGTGAESAERARHWRETGRRYPYYWFKVTPYLYGKSFDLSPDSLTNADIEYVQPGVAGTLTWVSSEGAFSFNLIGDFSHTDDIAQDGSLYEGGFSFWPSLQIGDTAWFNAPLFIGRVGVRPSLGLIARTVYVEDAGTNLAYANTQSFFRYGVDTGLKFFIPFKIKYFSSLEARVRYLYLEDTESVQNVERVEAGLAISPAKLQNITLEFDYADGQDETTLQDEDRWTAGLGLRF